MSETDARARAAEHLSDARLHYLTGEVAKAEAAYRAALGISPRQINALTSLARLLMEQRRSAEAVPLLEQAAALDSANADLRFQLGSAHLNLGKVDGALRWYQDCLRVQPDHGAAMLDLGVLLGRLGRSGEAEPMLRRAAALLPHAPRAHLELGVFLYRQGYRAEALRHFRTAQRLEPVHSVPARTQPAAFSVLFLWSPGVANTPMHYLTELASYDAHFALILEDGNNPDALRGYGDIVVNLLSDVDHGEAILNAAAGVCDALGKPVLNHPRRIFTTGRDAIARALADIPECRVPRTIRTTAAKIQASGATLHFPLLAREAGTHGGNDFELCASPGALAAFASARPDAEFYLSEYVDYRSVDGYFRKYRVFLMEGMVIPYHLAIGDQWKVHHFRTDMGAHDWMQREEETFLRAPVHVLTPACTAALRTIGERLGLDFCGVDFGIDRDGALVIFEANASMLVQPDDSAFAYKLAVNEQVKTAFGNVLARAVNRPEASR